MKLAILTTLWNKYTRFTILRPLKFKLMAENIKKFLYVHKYICTYVHMYIRTSCEKSVSYHNFNK